MILPSPWGQRSPAALSLGPLQDDVRCDVLVIGSGLSGALAAFHLVEAGLDVVVVEQRALASGATSASTALVQYELDVPLTDLIQQIGQKDAEAVYRATRGALDDLRELIDRSGIDCGLALRPSLYLARTASDVEHLRREAAAREQIGLEAEFLDATALAAAHRIRRPAAIRSSVAYQLDPRALATQLLSVAASRGARVYDHTTLRNDTGPGAIAIRETEQGRTITAGHIVYATGYQVPPWLPEVKAFSTFRTTYALVTRPLPDATLWPGRAMLWETGTPYFYARTTGDGRILIGGEDDAALDPHERQARLPAKSRALLQKLAATTGVSGVEVESAWAATFASTADGLPLIGSPPKHPSCSVTFGFGGNGIVFALLGAQIIRDTVAGRRNGGARLFDVGRIPYRDRAPGIEKGSLKKAIL